MKRIRPRDVLKRYRDLRVTVRSGTMSVIEVRGRYAMTEPLKGCDAMGVMLLDEAYPFGLSGQEAINHSLGLDKSYALGFFEGFAGHGRDLYDLDGPEESASYLVGHVDGSETWTICDPIARAKVTMLRAATLLMKRGWCRDMYDDKGSLTVDRAIRVALWGHEWMDFSMADDLVLVTEIIEFHLRKIHRIDNMTLPWWNDNVCVNGNQAIDLLIEIARA